MFPSLLSVTGRSRTATDESVSPWTLLRSWHEESDVSHDSGWNLSTDGCECGDSPFPCPVTVLLDITRGLTGEFRPAGWSDRSGQSSGPDKSEHRAPVCRLTHGTDSALTLLLHVSDCCRRHTASGWLAQIRRRKNSRSPDSQVPETRTGFHLEPHFHSLPPSGSRYFLRQETGSLRDVMQLFLFRFLNQWLNLTRSI